MLNRDEIRRALRASGIHVHDVTVDVREPNQVVVYLEGLHRQDERAQAILRRAPGVARVWFHPDTRAIMYAAGGP